MTDARIKVRSLLLVVVMIVGTVPAVGAGPVAADTTGNDAGNVPGDDPANAPDDGDGDGDGDDDDDGDDPANAPDDDVDAFTIHQGDEHYEVGAMGDGSQSVEEYYDYRKPANSEEYSYTYSSHGTTDLQENQVSNVFVYNGTDGYSLVMVHDELDVDGNEGEYGSTITFEFSNMDDVTWKVQDDNYTIDGTEQDDNWQTEGSDHEVDWMWGDNRTDGGAFSGIADNEVTITPKFNQDAPNWNETIHTGNEQPMDDWRLLDESGDTVTSLNMSEDVTVSPGEHSGDSSPNADLSAPSNPVGNAEEVTLDASGSADDEGIDEYEWDFDGDGEVDHTTSDATTTHTYDEPDTYDATVTVTDTGGNTATATETIEVKAGDAPTANLSVDKNVDAQKISFNASGSTDDGKVVKYEWDFDGDGEVDRTTPDDTTDKKGNVDHTVHHKIYTIYDEPETYDATVTVVYDDGWTDTASAEVTIEEDDEKPTASLDVPPEVTVGEEFTVEATDFSEDLKHVCWDFGGDHDAPEGAEMNHTFEETGEQKIELVLKDFAGNEKTYERTISVTKADDGSGDNGDDNKGDDGDDNKGDDDNNNDEENGFDGSPPQGSTGGGMPPADSSDDEQPLQDQPQNVTANLTDDGDHVGNVVVMADGSDDLGIEVYGTAPGGLPAPTPDADGFEAISFLDVTGADSANVTVAKDRLDDLDASPEAVTLFRHENGSWTAVETTLAEETDDAYLFGANVSDGTYAVGVERPAIGVADMNVQTQEITAGESATVAVTVENDGLAEGSQEVSLSVDGEVVATESVTLAGEDWTTVQFAPTFDAAGTYDVSAGDANAEVVVEDVQTDETTSTATETEQSDSGMSDDTTTDDSSTGVPGFGVTVALVALLAAALLALRRR